MFLENVFIFIELIGILVFVFLIMFYINWLHDEGFLADIKLVIYLVIFIFLVSYA